MNFLPLFTLFNGVVGSTLLCSTPSGTELHGDPVICPGSSAIFECKTTNTEVLIWDVNGTLLPIEGSGRVGYGITLSGNVASLVKLDLINGNGGNRTCLLFVPPANNVTMTITCGGGNPQSTCHRSITFLGTGGIERPVYGNPTRSEDGEFITHSWGHITEAIVSHYILTFMAAEDNGQLFRYNTNSTSIIIPSTSIDLNGTLSAVSVCGDMSGVVSFQVAGTTSGTTGLKSLSTILFLCLFMIALREVTY